MRSRLGRILFALVLGMSMIQVTGCATGKKEHRSAFLKKSGKKAKQGRRGSLNDGGNYSLFRKQDINYRILRQGKRARYSNSLDSY